uniref:Amino acid transporter transmembrane domain-containing protein n=1 Tax=Globodera rostochiensis TaxID=31243 RepID=A0A914HC65_GLORO
MMKKMPFPSAPKGFHGAFTGGFSAGYFTLRVQSMKMETHPNSSQQGQRTLQAEPVSISTPSDSNDVQALVRSTDRRQGDVISSHRAVLTLSKSMFNVGCFSLPYAWMLGGKWVSLALTFVIADFNWYGNHILVRSAQHLAKKSGVPSLDYGHFAKRVCDYSEVPFLRQNSKRIMYVVNITILFYQLGMCAVAILFIAENMVHMLGSWLGNSTTLMATIATVFITFTNICL